MRYVYPAVFIKEDDGYSVEFPDVKGCVTCGDNLDDAIQMAEDALALMLFHIEAKGEAVPVASDVLQISPPHEGFVSLIRCDTLEYCRRTSKKAVKKTLSIPEYLDIAATEAGLNFSKILQEGLIKKLGLG